MEGKNENEREDVHESDEDSSFCFTGDPVRFLWFFPHVQGLWLSIRTVTDSPSFDIHTDEYRVVLSSMDNGSLTVLCPNFVGALFMSDFFRICDLEFVISFSI